MKESSIESSKLPSEELVLLGESQVDRPPAYLCMALEVYKREIDDLTPNHQLAFGSFLAEMEKDGYVAIGGGAATLHAYVRELPAVEERSRGDFAILIRGTDFAWFTAEYYGPALSKREYCESAEFMAAIDCANISTPPIALRTLKDRFSAFTSVHTATNSHGDICAHCRNKPLIGSEGPYQNFSTNLSPWDQR